MLRVVVGIVFAVSLVGSTVAQGPAEVDTKKRAEIVAEIRSAYRTTRDTTERQLKEAKARLNRVETNSAVTANAPAVEDQPSVGRLLFPSSAERQEYTRKQRDEVAYHSYTLKELAADPAMGVGRAIRTPLHSGTPVGLSGCGVRWKASAGWWDRAPARTPLRCLTRR